MPPARLLGDAHGGGDRARHQPGVGDRGELDHPGAVGVLVHDVEADLDGEPGLPHAAGADDGQHAGGRQRGRRAPPARSPGPRSRPAGTAGCARPRRARAAGGRSPAGRGAPAGTGAPERGSRAAGRSPAGPPSRPAGSRPAAAVAVASDIRTWPPCAPAADAGGLVHGEGDVAAAHGGRRAGVQADADAHVPAGRPVHGRPAPADRRGPPPRRRPRRRRRAAGRRPRSRPRAPACRATASRSSRRCSASSGT